MNPPRIARRAALLAALVGLAAIPAAPADEQRRPDYTPAAYAIRGAKVVAGNGQTFDPGTVVIRRGVIEAVGPESGVTVPADAEVVEGKGLVVYPGFLDLYTTLGANRSSDRSATGAGRPIPYGEFALPSTPPDNRNGLTPEYQVADGLTLSDDEVTARRKLGFTAIVAAPGGSVATGQGAVVSLGGLPRREAIIKTPLALHISVRPPSEPITPPGPDEDPAAVRRRFQNTTINYPMSLMGTVAHLRQAMLDAEYDHDAWAYYRDHGGERPAVDPALQALHQARIRELPTWWEANSRDEILRALDLAREFGTTATIVGGRDAYRVTDALKEANAPVVVRVDFPDEPEVPEERAFAKKELTDRVTPRRVLENRKAKWEERVKGVGDLAGSGVRIAFTTDGLDRAASLPDKVRLAIKHGLSAEAALKALTKDAAEIAGLGDRLGTIEAGKLGHVVVMDKAFEEPKAAVRYVFVDGLKFENKPETEASGQGGRRPGAGRRNQGDEPAKEGDKPAEDEKPADPKKAAQEPGEEKTDEGRPAVPTRDTAKPYLEDQPSDTPFADVASELEEDRKPTLRTGGDVLIGDARILTVSPAGTIERGSILVRNGKIAAIGEGLEAPEGVTVIDARGLVAMPGIIDTHSHMAISGGVNEMSLSIVPEVRVADVIDGDDSTIYRALAGGTTAARLLHGSANAIGGQDAIIKLKHGQPGRDLLLKDEKRPQGVKFALGENVTRRRDRFPNTRMGVEATIERGFLEGRAYAEARKAYEEAKAKGEPLPPFRRDLRLEALAAILDGSIKIHSHCYRNDEILMLLRLAERFGVRVQSLQHVLEGYKVAAEIAAHGASASTFSDWWAYKVEAYDAIPQNAALLTEAGANVCIKSDSEELVRHLYLEAAKMVKYGGATEAQALAMITLNPAKELGLDHRMGSIEVGKDADIALFNAHPFDGFARCQISIIDGEVWFQRDEEGNKLDTRDGDGIMPVASAEARDREVAIEPNADGLYALVGATLHPVSGPAIEDGVLVIDDGRIVAIGGPGTRVPQGAQTVELDGLDVWPGMVDAGSLVGLFEIGSLPETQDFADSAPYQPELRTSTALHPDSAVIPVTRANGVLSAFVQPAGGTIAGQGCLADFDGWVPSEMVQVDRLALLVNIPTYRPPSPDGGRGRGRGGDSSDRRTEQLDGIREQFKKAIAYDDVVKAARDGKAEAPTPDPRLEALVPYARGQKLVVFRADRAQEILDALKIAAELKLKAAISGGLEAWKVAGALNDADVPVIVAGTLRLPGDATDPYDAAYANPAKLHEAGVTLAIRSVGQGPDQATAARNLPYEAAAAIAFGLPEDEGLKAVTLAPAMVLGVEDQLGSLDVGKRANVVITAGHLLQPTTMVKALFIGGKPLAPESKQTELYATYRERLNEVRNGKAALGLDRRDGESTGQPARPEPVGAGSGDRR